MSYFCATCGVPVYDGTGGPAHTCFRDFLQAKDQPVFPNPDALDAARYRWLRQQLITYGGVGIRYSGESLDNSVDKGMAAYASIKGTPNE